MFYIIVILATIFAMPAQAQSLRDQLIGAWSLERCDPKFRALVPVCGTNPNGILIYEASGQVVWIIAARDRPKASAGRNSPTEELATLARGMLVQFGTWSVNEDKTITVHINGALFPNIEGTTNSNTIIISLSGDELRIADKGGPPDAYNVYRRISK
jgi:hypothetical protein